MAKKSNKKKRGLCGTDSFYIRHPYITCLGLMAGITAVEALIVTIIQK